MVARVVRYAPWLTFGGVVLLLVGLAWDAALHRLDPHLAQRQGFVTGTNLGHALLIAGIGLAAAGTLLMVAGRAAEWLPRHRGRGLTLAGAALGLGALAVTSLGLALWRGGDLTEGPRTQAAAQGGEDTASMAGGHAAMNMAAGGGVPVKTTSSKLPGVTHNNGVAVAVTAAELAAAAKLADDVRAQTARLQDFAVARSEGYVQITGGRNGLAHFHNQAYHTDGRILDPARPEQLMYYRMPSGEMRLVGVMFLMPPGEAGPRIGGALTAWHAHDNLCYSTASGVIVALTDATGKCPAGSAFRGASPEMMHVWLLDNPDGVFSDDMEPAALLQQIADGSR